MSRTYSTIGSEHQKRSKTYRQAFFNHPKEPRGRISEDILSELDDEIIENSEQMRHEFRRLAARIRNG